MRKPEHRFYYTLISCVLAVALLGCATNVVEGSEPTAEPMREVATATEAVMTPTQALIPTMTLEPSPTATATPPELKETSVAWYPLELEQVFIPKMVGYDSGGVYNDGVYRVVQQPADMPVFVGSREDELTQFKMAAEHGTIALLAHVYLDTGLMIAGLTDGDSIVLYRPDGSTDAYVVTEQLRLWALSPSSVVSDFVPVDGESAEYMRRAHPTDTDGIYSAAQVFSVVFGNPDDEGSLAVLQTCIIRDLDGNGSISANELGAGRLFVLAEQQGEDQ